MSQDTDRDAEADRTDEERRLDRNWDDLLQELRVAQTGVQLLTGLLLTVPFQARFHELLAHQPHAVPGHRVTVGAGHRPADQSSGAAPGTVPPARPPHPGLAGQRFALCGFARARAPRWSGSSP